MKKSVLKAYAKLAIRMGVNIQKNQELIITANVNDNYFVKYLVEEAYKAKAKLVTVEWVSDEVEKLTNQKASLKTLTEFPLWKEEKLKYQVENLPARLYVDSSDPDAMAGVDQDKMTEVRKVIGPKIMKYREQMDNKYQWCIIGIPGEAWAHKVFPDLPVKKAVSKLWDAILEVTRINGDPIDNWNKHNAFLQDKTDKLNNLNIKKFIYKSKSSGTDFTIEKDERLIFESGNEKTISGVVYNPNMPTEECFTSPKKYSANGVIYSSKALSVMGKVVDNFGFRFEDGKAVEVFAKKEEDKAILEKLISIDEGASRLGEIALVPFSSPINKTGILFYSTLYDENACCHVALGRAFEECIKDFTNKSEKEIKDIDLNKSVIHVDFMIGTADLDIVGETYDGKTVQIFKDGEFAI
ncbi:MAG: aminopeptidase [Acholeplasmatales bacterium]|nr:aminopeptidase [Acholeplasmatales bacterium]